MHEDGPASAVDGSSPHTRGARPWRAQTTPCVGIIPAYAGSTSIGVMAPARISDHPRIRGEHIVYDPDTFAEFGSSPHTRGARERAGQGRVGRGIIPAYAGSTAPLTTATSTRTDHPRIRGEHRMAVELLKVVRGSSPHTRGAHRLPLDQLPLERIIPAYAGSTPTSSSSAR